MPDEDPNSEAGLVQSKEFEQDFGARLRVVHLRVRAGLSMVAGVLVLGFGGVSLLESGWTYRLLGLGTIAVVMTLTGLAGLSSLQRARQAEPGRLVLTEVGMRFESNDFDSKSGDLRWAAVGEVVRTADWQLRRQGVVTLAVLPPGQARWRTSGMRGSFGNALLVVSWLRVADAARVVALTRAHVNQLNQS
jgi:hypothetical protein